MQTYRVNEIENKLILGRNGLNEQGLALFWSGSGIELNVKARSLYVNIDCAYDDMELMMDIIIEGERTQKLVLDRGLKKYMVFNGMIPEKPVNVRIIRDTQCMTEEKNHHMIIKSFETDGYFEQVEEYGYNIEFIGDSLTSGEGCGLTKRVEWIPVIFDATENYSYKTAKILNAGYQVISESGWGLYASWDANLNNVLPDYYEKTCGTSKDSVSIAMGAHEEWSFSGPEMDAVIVNLGTNDSGALKTGKFEREAFIEAFKDKGREFLKTIRKHNNSCMIVWAYGMLGNDMEPYIIEIIESYKAESGDTRVEYLRLPECTGEELGVRAHPTPGAHEKIARCLAEHLQSLQAFMLR